MDGPQAAEKPPLREQGWVLNTRLSGTLTGVPETRKKEVNMATTKQEPIALTYKQAAELVGVDIRRISAGVDAGTIPSVALGARKVIPRAALLALFGIAA